MNQPSYTGIQSAAVLVPCPELDPTLAFFSERLGFRLESVFPADEPRVAVLNGHGVRVQLEVDGPGAPGVLRLTCTDPALAGGTRGAEEQTLLAPNGTRIEFVALEPLRCVPSAAPEFTLSRLRGDSPWQAGRAGMRYRDLIPGRQAGRVIASHIAIESGGPVPDYVHFHRVQFQMIYCYRGWVRVAYEDQGEPLVMHPGDCVLQPPGIRHRVLECSDGLEVVEFTAPAEHTTFAEHDLELPSPERVPERRFDGQQFHFDAAANAEWRTWHLPGFEARDLGMHAATSGVATAHVLRGMGSDQPRLDAHDEDLVFLFVLKGTIHMSRRDQDEEPLDSGDAIVLPRDLEFGLGGGSDETELLVVSMPRPSILVEDAGWPQGRPGRTRP